VDMPILVIHHRWIELILLGIKIIEMRTEPCPHEGKTVALCSSGAGNRKYGFYCLGVATISATLEKGVMAPNQSRFAGRRVIWDGEIQKATCVGGSQWPDKYIFGWELVDVKAFDRPVRYLESEKGEGTVWRYNKRGSWVDTASDPHSKAE
jgi:hypothetical protein